MSGTYLLIVSALIVAGVEFSHRFSIGAAVLYWFVIGLLVIPWSIISLGLFLASFHAGGFEMAQFSLALGAILNSFAIYHFFARYNSATE